MVRILVIDDDALIRETLKTMLQLEGHEVTPHGEEGVRHFREQAVDLVICDNLHAEARQDGDDRGDPQRADDRDRGQDLHMPVGATATIAKPFRPLELFGLIGQCLDDARRLTT